MVHGNRHSLFHSDNDSTEKCNFVAMLDGMEVWDKAEMRAERDSRMMKLSDTQRITNSEIKDRANIFVEVNNVYPCGTTLWTD